MSFNPFDTIIDTTRRVQRLERQQPQHPRASTHRNKWGLFELRGTLTCGASPDVTFVDWGPESGLPGGFVRGDVMPDGNYAIRGAPGGLFIADFRFVFDTSGWSLSPSDFLMSWGWSDVWPSGLELLTGGYATMNVGVFPIVSEFQLVTVCSHGGLNATADVILILYRLSSGSVELHLTPEGDL